MKNEKDSPALNPTTKPAVARPQKLTSLKVRTGVKAGVAQIGCPPCHVPN